jgi:glycosyltransferase involved in cell wall biosynthesis
MSGSGGNGSGARDAAGNGGPRRPARTIASYALRMARSPDGLRGGLRTRPNGNHSEPPLVSVVTVTYQAAEALERTIASVRAQVGTSVEHLVIDGGSTDGTVDLLRRHDDHLALWLSEPDSGIYDAMNKGIALARGRHVGLLNADTVYYDERALARVADAAATGVRDVIYGDMVHHERETDVRIYMRSSHDLRPEMTLSHEATFIPRVVYERCGLYSDAWPIGADYELCVRLMRAGVSFRRIPEPLVVFASGGLTDRRFLDASLETIALHYRLWGPRAALHFSTLAGRRLLMRAVFAGIKEVAAPSTYAVLRRSYLHLKEQVLDKHRPV